jgi:hypothetical protein
MPTLVAGGSVDVGVPCVAGASVAGGWLLHEASQSDIQTNKSKGFFIVFPSSTVGYGVM